MVLRSTLTLSALLALAACENAGPPAVARFDEPALTATPDVIPDGAAPGACYGRDETPATVETVTEHVLVQPPEIGAGGNILRPAIYRTVTRQTIIDERKDIWFETPCPALMTTEFVTSLQRALKVRGHYRGPVTGTVNAATRRAVRAFQLTWGLNSPVLSIAAAKRLGLVVYDRAEAVAAG